MYHFVFDGYNMRIIKFLIEQKLRLDMTTTFINLSTFGMVAWQFSEKLGIVTTPLKSLFVLGLLLVAWAFGWFMDSRLKYLQNFQTLNNVRNPLLCEVLENTRELVKKVR